eukprot:m.216177 g.216177  ORF g.216177 m.216177 type:complete len:581 (+) comp13803_c0_seq1:128-1870(+)
MSTLKTVPEQSALDEDSPLSSTYELGKLIGKGNFAKVYLAKHKVSGVEVAVKIIEKTNLNPEGLYKVNREVRILKKLNHPNIVKLYEVCDTPKKLYLIMEYASGGEVFDYLVDKGRMKEKDARVKFRQILSAIEYCHANGIVHRDLKAENLLLSKDLNIKIADFGFANTFEEGRKLDTFCGSPPYAAPELFLGRQYDGPEVDVWSLGVILYTLVSGALPFDGETLRDLRARVLKGRYRIPFFMSTECEQLLKKFLIINAPKRISLRKAMQEKWINHESVDEPLCPYEHPQLEIDDRRIKAMEKIGFDRAEVIEALETSKYNHCTSTYLLITVPDHEDNTTADEEFKGFEEVEGYRPATTMGVPVDDLKNRAFSTHKHGKKKPGRRMSMFSFKRKPAAQFASTREQTNDAAKKAPNGNGVAGGEDDDDEEEDEDEDEEDGGLHLAKMKQRSKPRRRTITEGGVHKQKGVLSRMRASFKRASISERQQPRSLRFSFSTANTSSKTADELMDEMKRVLTSNDISFEESQGSFLLMCKHKTTQFEMEVCKLPRLSMNAIRHKRISGPSVDYKNVCSKLLNEMDL